MKWILLLFLMHFNAGIYAAKPTHEMVRTLYKKSFQDEKSCKTLIQLLQPYNEKNIPLFLGYNGIAHMMMSQFVRNPFSKLSYFNKGKQMLEKAITATENSIELKFLRFSVQQNAPSFLNYNQNLAADKKFILTELPNIQDSSLKTIILTYFNQNK